MKIINSLLLTTLAITIVLLGCKSNTYKPKDKINAQNEVINYPLFDQYFNDLGNFSGNVLVALSGKPIYKNSFGYANIELEVKNTSETKFRIGSITKQFTSMAIMILQEQGKLVLLIYFQTIFLMYLISGKRLQFTNY